MNKIATPLVPALATKDLIMKRLFLMMSMVGLMAAPMRIKAQSLDTLIQRAFQENTQLQIIQKEYATAISRIGQVGQLPDPEVGLGLFPLPVETRLGPQILRLSATQMFPWFGTFGKMEALEDAKAKPILEKAMAKMLQIKYQVTMAYLDYHLYKKSQAILRQNIPLLESLEEVALAKVESGSGSLADVLRIQLQLQEIEQELEILEEQSRLPLTTINRWTKSSTVETLRIVDSLQFASLDRTLEDLLSEIKKDHPALRILELQKDVSRAALEVNKYQNKPSFGAGLDYIMVNGRDDVELDNNGRDIIQLRAAVKIPLFKDRYRSRIVEEQLKIETYELGKEDLLSEIKADLEKAYTLHEMASLRYQLYLDQIEITRSTRDILEASYSVEGRSFDELLQIEKSLIDYQLKVLRSTIDSHRAIAQIDQFLIPDNFKRDEK